MLAMDGALTSQDPDWFFPYSRDQSREPRVVHSREQRSESRLVVSEVPSSALSL